IKLEINTVRVPRVIDRGGSIIEAKNKIRLGHDECCNCCCCCSPQPKCLKYVQPEKTKPFKPMRFYSKQECPMDDQTTYKLSFWDGPVTVRSEQATRPPDSLTVGDGPISEETVHKMSYLGNWCVQTEPPCMPCTRSWVARGPVQDVTTHKHDYTWKMVEREEPYSEQQGNSLHIPCAAMSDDTTYRLSYYNSTCRIPVKPFKPFRRYEKSDVPMDGCTTYRLSYWPNEATAKEPQPWNSRLSYVPPTTPMDGCTTYKLSYWPHREPRRTPYSAQQESNNVLNAGCCFDDNTTYNLSYFGCGGERPPAAKPLPNADLFSKCPLSYDTVNRLSYLGNWCVKPDPPCIPCTKNLMARGPMQDVTTQRHDYTWKSTDFELAEGYHPEDSLVLSPLPLDCCTTHRLSYFPNNIKCLTREKPFKPARKYCPQDVPMDSETTMSLSYQPVEIPVPQEKPWITTAAYNPPVIPVDDSTTYNLSYIPPGTLVPSDEPCDPPPDLCAVSPSPFPCPSCIRLPCDTNAFSPLP
ncbi:stabilizer of axonemal microtubules 1-like, partial [Venturia canescens]|uniref:stabilizer of axonemal microtubules 1-like n=1 Tax=Venturia canescens TaxID=32260 RepID=UPI001C9C9CD3